MPFRIGFVFSPKKAQNAQKASYLFVIKELAPILTILTLALFFQITLTAVDAESEVLDLNILNIRYCLVFRI